MNTITYTTEVDVELDAQEMLDLVIREISTSDLMESILETDCVGGVLEAARQYSRADFDAAIVDYWDLEAITTHFALPDILAHIYDYAEKSDMKFLIRDFIGAKPDLLAPAQPDIESMVANTDTMLLLSLIIKKITAENGSPANP